MALIIFNIQGFHVTQARKLWRMSTKFANLYYFVLSVRRCISYVNFHFRCVFQFEPKYRLYMVYAISLHYVDQINFSSLAPNSP